MDVLIRRARVAPDFHVLGFDGAAKEPIALPEEPMAAVAVPGGPEQNGHALQDAALAARLEAELSRLRSEWAEKAHTEARSLFEEARGRGRMEGEAEGLAAGRAEGARELAAAAASVRAIAESIRENTDQRLTQAEPLAVEIAFESVCNLLGSESADRAWVAQLVRQTIQRRRQGEILRVRVSAADLSHLASSAEGSALRAALPVGVEFVADDAVGPGGCIVDTSTETLDGRLQTQLRRLLEALTSTIAAGSEREDRP